MQSDFETCLNITLGFEGGYVNDPKDPGGATNMGVTQTTYDAFRLRNNQPVQAVINLTRQEAAGIYLADYWNRLNGDHLPGGLDLAVFDMAVNSGVAQAVETLQKLLPVIRADGVMGSLTLNALPTEQTAVAALIEKYDAARLAFMKRLKTWNRFGAGWTTRVSTLTSIATAHAVDNISAAPVASQAAKVVLVPVGTGKAQPQSTALIKSPMAAGALAAATGGAGQSVLHIAQQVQPHIDTTPFGHMALAASAVLFGTGGLLVGFSWYRKLKDSGFSFQEAFS